MMLHSSFIYNNLFFLFFFIELSKLKMNLH